MMVGRKSSYSLHIDLSNMRVYCTYLNVPAAGVCSRWHSYTSTSTYTCTVCFHLYLNQIHISPISKPGTPPISELGTPAYIWASAPAYIWNRHYRLNLNQVLPPISETRAPAYTWTRYFRHIWTRYSRLSDPGTPAISEPGTPAYLNQVLPPYLNQILPPFYVPCTSSYIWTRHSRLDPEPGTARCSWTRYSLLLNQALAKSEPNTPTYLWTRHSSPNLNQVLPPISEQGTLGFMWTMYSNSVFLSHVFCPDLRQPLKTGFVSRCPPQADVQRQLQVHYNGQQLNSTDCGHESLILKYNGHAVTLPTSRL